MSPNTQVRSVMQGLGNFIKSVIPPGWGFALFVFPFDDREGLLNYISDGERKQIIATMKEFIARNEKAPTLDVHHEEVP